MSEQEKQEEEKSRSLDILFPKKSVPIGPDVSIGMRPIALSDLSQVMGSFLKLAQLHAGGMKDADMALFAMKEILEMLPLCIDHPLKEIPHTAFPDLLGAFLELNMTEDLVSKWTALAGQLKGMKRTGEGKAGVPGQSPKA